MPQGPAARLGDSVAHPLPPTLGPGVGSMDVIIETQPAWRGMPLAAVAAIMALKATNDALILAAEAASLAASGTPGAPAAIAAEKKLKIDSALAMTNALQSAGPNADKHMCTTPPPPTPEPPHALGMVTTGSVTVLINGMPACRMGDTIIEALGPPNSITSGAPTVMIGDSTVSGQGGALQAASAAGKPFAEYCPYS